MSESNFAEYVNTYYKKILNRFNEINHLKFTEQDRNYINELFENAKSLIESGKYRSAYYQLTMISNMISSILIVNDSDNNDNQ